MEKLIELLNKAQNSGEGLFGQWTGNFKRKHYAKNHWKLIIDTDEDYEVYDYSDRDICGKDVGFIKWLVENDKIDLDMVKEKLGIPCFTRYSEGKIICVHDVEDYEQLLMLLSISNTPIEDLISYLK